MRCAKELAREILRVQDVREATWNDKASAYDVSMKDAAFRYCKTPGLAEIVYLLCTYAWEDSRAWAENILKK